MTNSASEFVDELKVRIERLDDAVVISKAIAAKQLAALQKSVKRTWGLIQISAHIKLDVFTSQLSSVVVEEFVGLLVFSQDEGLQFANDVARKILGSELPDSENRFDVDDVYYLADRTTPCGESLPWAQALSGREIAASLVYMRRPNAGGLSEQHIGNVFNSDVGTWLKFSAIPIKKKSDGTVLGAAILFIDFTEYILAEQQANEAKVELEQRLRSTSSAHDNLTVLAGKLGSQSWNQSSDSAHEASSWNASAAGADKIALVVDDSKVNQILLGAQLSNLGFSVHCADNGKESVEAASKHHYDLILMDCDMPVMDGYTATRQIRSRETNTGWHVPILALTAFNRVSEREKCLSAGMDEYLPKCFDQSKLFKAIASISDQRVSGSFSLVPSTPAADSNGTVIGSQASGLNMESLQGLYGRDLPDILGLYLETTRVLVQCLDTALAEREVRATHHYAYCIKGPSASLGNYKLAKLCEDTAESAIRGKWFDCDDNFAEMRLVIKAMNQIVEAGKKQGTADSTVNSVNSVNRVNSVNGTVNGTAGESEIAAASTIEQFLHPVNMIDELKKQLGEPTANAVFAAFLDDTEQILDVMDSALQRHDKEKLRQAAHKLVGCAASIQDRDTKFLSQKLEQLAQEAQWLEANEIFEQLSDTFNRTEKMLQNHLVKIGSSV